MFKKYIRIDTDKNAKVVFYLKSIVNLLTPSSYFQKKLAPHLKEAKQNQSLLKRANYYNKTNSFTLPNNAVTIDSFQKEKKKTYFFDLLRYLKYFNKNLKISYLFGDVTHVPDVPTIVKSRPIDGDNTNAVLMKLNSVRHFIFVNDTLSFEEKKEILVWRGKAYVPHRTAFLKKFHNHPKCDIGQTNTRGDLNVPWQKKKLSLKQQLDCKFILAIEGNDVASNLKWAMSSNSLVFMCKPKYETWFMEGLLQPNHHYVLLQDDYSDLEEKIDYYCKNVKEAKKIIANAHEHVRQFLDDKTETLCSLLVLNKYFTNSSQL
jgi:hypothetical protein